MSGDDYANSSLESLIKVFRKLSDNESLVTELNKFKDERNFLSHTGIAHCLDYEGELFHSTAIEFQGRLEAIQGEAKRLRIALHEEAINSVAICGSKTYARGLIQPSSVCKEL